MIIGPGKYSNEPTIIPEAIVLTFPKMFFEDRGWTCAEFEKHFERYMQKEDALWNFRLTNLPKHDVAWVYLVFDGFIQFECNFVQYERNKAKVFDDTPDGTVRKFDKTNWILFTGPAIRPPYDFPQKGFQGFRYSIKLF